MVRYVAAKKNKEMKIPDLDPWMKPEIQDTKIGSNRTNFNLRSLVMRKTAPETRHENHAGMRVIRNDSGS